MAYDEQTGLAPRGGNISDVEGIGAGFSGVGGAGESDAYDPGHPFGGDRDVNGNPTSKGFAGVGKPDELPDISLLPWYSYLTSFFPGANNGSPSAFLFLFVTSSDAEEDVAPGQMAADSETSVTGDEDFDTMLALVAASAPGGMYEEDINADTVSFVGCGIDSDGFTNFFFASKPGVGFAYHGDGGLFSLDVASGADSGTWINTQVITTSPAPALPGP